MTREGAGAGGETERQDQRNIEARRGAELLLDPDGDVAKAGAGSGLIEEVGSRQTQLSFRGHAKTQQSFGEVKGGLALSHRVCESILKLETAGRDDYTRVGDGGPVGGDGRRCVIGSGVTGGEHDQDAGGRERSHDQY